MSQHYVCEHEEQQTFPLHGRFLNNVLTCDSHSVEMALLYMYILYSCYFICKNFYVRMCHFKNTVLGYNCHSH